MDDPAPHDRPKAAEPSSDLRFFERLMALGLLAALLFACFQITLPFIGPFLWGIIITVSTWAPYRYLTEALGGRKKLAAILMSSALVLVLVAPVAMLVNSLADGVVAVAGLVRDLTRIELPQPPDWLSQIPIVGPSIAQQWRDSMGDLPATLSGLQPYIGTATGFALAGGANLGFAVIEFLVAVVIAGILYVTGETALNTLTRVVVRVAGEHQLGLIDIAGRTIRGVAQGVIGTAFVQGILSLIGFLIVGAPGSAVLAFLVFFASVLQIPNLVVWVPVSIWLFYRGSFWLAIFLLGWGFLVVSTVDNFIRPYLISQGARLPLLLIFVGVIGGLLAYGFIGIFIGATLLAVSYTMFYSWLDGRPRP